jgi:transcriptional repressor AefR-like protein
MRSALRNLFRRRKAIPRGTSDGRTHIEGVPDELAIEIDQDGSPVSMAPVEWFVCFVPGLQKQWWHRFTDPRHKHVFALRMVSDDHWILFEPWWTRIMNTMLTLDEAVKFLRWGGIGSVLRVKELIPGDGSQTRGWANCAVLVSLLLGRSYWTWTPHGLYQALSRERDVEEIDVPEFLESHLIRVAQRQAELAVGSPKAADNESIQEMLRDAGIRLTTMMTSPVALGVYRVAVSEAFHFPTASEAFFEIGPTRIVESVVELLSSAQQRGEIRCADLHICAKQFIAMLRGNLHLEIILGCRETPDADAIKDRVDSVVDVFLHGMRSSSSDWNTPSFGQSTPV